MSQETSFRKNRARIKPTPMSDSYTLVNETTYRKALNQIQSRIKNASHSCIHIYFFNIPLDQLQAAHALPDKEEERKSMNDAITSSLDTCLALNGLMTIPMAPSPPGCKPVGATTERNRQIGVSALPNPSVLALFWRLEAPKASYWQLRIDARLWIELMPEVQVVILISIDSPLPAQLTLPCIIIELRNPLLRPSCTAVARQRQASKVWEADWTLNATPLYIPFAGIFGTQPVPAAYGNNSRVVLNTAWLRQEHIMCNKNRAFWETYDVN